MTVQAKKVSDKLHPKDFVAGSIVESVYTGIVYKIVEPNKKGMAKLLNINSGRAENWNADNNAHFVKAEKQLKLFV